MDRRNFLTTTAVTTGLVWAAPAITTVATASATGTPPPCEHPPGSCLAVGYGLSLALPPLIPPLVLGDGTCVADVGLLLAPGSVNSATICGATSASPCYATGFAEGLRVVVPNLVVSASVLRATAASNGGCDCSTSGTSVIVGLRINGRIITVDDEVPVNHGIHVVAPCNTHLPDFSPVLDVILNEQICTGNQFVVNALHVHSEVLGLDLVVGHAESGRANCVCDSCSPTT